MTPYLLESLKIILAFFAVMQIVVLLVIVIFLARQNKYEIILRAIAVISAVLLYIIAVASGVKFPDLISAAMYYPPFARIFPEFGVYLVGFAIPVIFGISISSYVSNYVKYYKEIEASGSRSVSIRWMCLIITVLILLYIDQYMHYYKDVSDDIATLKPLLPNATFVLSVLLFAVFRFRPEKPITTMQAGTTDDRPGRSLTRG
jgi:hypothetical protein